MNIHEFRKIIDDIDDALPDYSDKVVTVRIVGDKNFVPSKDDDRVFGSSPSVKVTGVIQGFDWDAWQIMLSTEQPLFVKK